MWCGVLLTLLSFWLYVIYTATFLIILYVALSLSLSLTSLYLLLPDMCHFVSKSVSTVGSHIPRTANHSHLDCRGVYFWCVRVFVFVLPARQKNKNERTNGWILSFLLCHRLVSSLTIIIDSFPLSFRPGHVWCILGCTYPIYINNNTNDNLEHNNQHKNEHKQSSHKQKQNKQQSWLDWV